MGNPWEKIKLDDYENHMSLESVYQLQALNEMMKGQFQSEKVSSVMILGVAGGNGLEHIHTDRIKKVYGVDVNRDFLVQCGNRYSYLGKVFEPICADLLRDDIQLPHADLLVANLLVEYIGYPCFQRVATMVAPRYISCIIQINTGGSFVSDSPYLHAFDGLGEVHHQMEEDALTKHVQEIGYVLSGRMERSLPNGKKFVQLDFVIQ